MLTMKLTKYEHATMVLEEQGSKFIIDPGEFADLPDLSEVVGVYVSHLHPDHMSAENISKIIQTNPKAILFTSEEVQKQLEAVKCERRNVVGYEEVECAPFLLHSFGYEHAAIYGGSPCENAGIMLNNSFYYPGDSFTVPELPVKLLALPASAPWMKVSEAINFMKDVKPQIVVPVHDMLLSDIGKQITYNWYQKACAEIGAEFKVLNVGESIEF